MRNWWLVIYFAGLATAIGLAIGAALALANGPCDGLTGAARERCECRAFCAPYDGTLIDRVCTCTPKYPRNTSCHTSDDCIGRGGECVSGVCHYPDGSAKQASHLHAQQTQRKRDALGKGVSLVEKHPRM